MVAGVALALGWAGFLLLDVVNPWGIRYSPFWQELTPFGFFFWYFREGGPVEVLQWSLLLIAVLGCIALAVRSTRLPSKPLVWVFRAGALGIIWMLAEDATNIRHVISLELTVPIFAPDGPMKNHVRTLTELALYAVLGGIMVSFLLGVRRCAVRRGNAWRLLLGAYAFYGVAAVASATRYVGDWYEKVGGLFVPLLQPGVQTDYERVAPFVPEYGLGFWLMDWLVEESLELMGAALLASAVLHLVSWAQLEPKSD